VRRLDLMRIAPAQFETMLAIIEPFNKNMPGEMNIASAPQGRERRKKRRFSLHLKVQCTAWSLGKAHTGDGTTANLSSEGVFFRASREYGVGSYLWLVVAWPAKRGRRPMELRIRGIVLRAASDRIALRILHSRLCFRPPGPKGGISRRARTLQKAFRRRQK
jgi:hypothetical protein